MGTTADPLLTIKGWDDTFESPAESRRPKGAMNWVQIPVGNDSKGKRELFRMGKEGYVAYAMFVSLLQWSASKSICQRGTVANSDGSAMSMLDLSEVLRMDVKTVEKSVSLLIIVGWLNKSDQVCAKMFGLDQKCSLQDRTGQDRTGQNKTEQDITKQNKTTSPSKSAMVDVPLGDLMKNQGKKLTKIGRATVADAVFAAYLVHKPRSKLGAPDKKRILARLAEDFTGEELVSAICGNFKSPFHCGENKDARAYHNLDLIFRDAGKVNQFIELDNSRTSRKKPTAVYDPGATKGENYGKV